MGDTIGGKYCDVTGAEGRLVPRGKGVVKAAIEAHVFESLMALHRLLLKIDISGRSNSVADGRCFKLESLGQQKS